MKGLFNHHTHSFFCDGSDEPEAYVVQAIKAGFHTLGFSSHAPVHFKNNFAIQDDLQLKKYCSAILHLEEKYVDKIRICLGLEIDFIEGISTDFEKLRHECGLDFTIGSVHLVRNGPDRSLWFIDGPRVESYDNGIRDVFHGDIRKAVTAYYSQTNQMILSQKPDILGHFDKVKMHNKGRYFSEDEDWYRSLVMDTIDVIRQCGTIIEVNTRGIYKKRSKDFYPGDWVLRKIHDLDLPVTISSDAHRPEEIGGHYPETIKALKEIGFRGLWHFHPDGWKEQAI